MVILDNCEHPPACAALADTLVRSCLSVQVLATSRAPLTVEGEVPWRVPNLSAPAKPAPVGLDTLDSYEAVRLFIERACQARPNFEVTNETLAWRWPRSAIGSTGYPWPSSWPPPGRGCSPATDLRWAHRPLPAARRPCPHRHPPSPDAPGFRRLELPAVGRPGAALLHRLSVFAGAVGLDTVEAVCEGDGLERPRILDVLAGLIDKSLVVVDDEGAAASYRLLETIREYADARLIESVSASGCTAATGTTSSRRPSGSPSSSSAPTRRARWGCWSRPIPTWPRRSSGAGSTTTPTPCASPGAVLLLHHPGDALRTALVAGGAGRRRRICPVARERAGRRRPPRGVRRRRDQHSRRSPRRSRAPAGSADEAASPERKGWRPS